MGFGNQCLCYSYQNCVSGQRTESSLNAKQYPKHTAGSVCWLNIGVHVSYRLSLFGTLAIVADFLSVSQGDACTLGAGM